MARRLDWDSAKRGDRAKAPPADLVDPTENPAIARERTAYRVVAVSRATGKVVKVYAKGMKTEHRARRVVEKQGLVDSATTVIAIQLVVEEIQSKPVNKVEANRRWVQNWRKRNGKA